jgi:hypothetical protein
MIQRTLLYVLTALLLLSFNQHATSNQHANTQVGSAFFPDYNAFENAIDDLLGSYVNDAGYVDYQAWSEDVSDMTLLNALVQAFAGFDPDDHEAVFANQDAALAHYINAYNIFAIHEVLQRYPVDTIRPTVLFIPERSFFTEQRYQLLNDQYSLDELENEIIRADFGEPRIHFAINCASFSCPKLRPEAYVSERLDEQLNEQTRQFLNDSERNQFDIDNNIARISKIFDWFAEDFEDAGGVASYLSQFAEGDTLELLSSEDVNITYMSYNWRLNSQQLNP